MQVFVNIISCKFFIFVLKIASSANWRCTNGQLKANHFFFFWLALAKYYI